MVTRLALDDLKLLGRHRISNFDAEQFCSPAALAFFNLFGHRKPMDTYLDDCPASWFAGGNLKHFKI